MTDSTTPCEHAGRGINHLASAVVLPGRLRQLATFRPGARLACSGAFACLAMFAAPPAAPAQDAGDRPSVLLVLDASRSMRAPAGDASGSRMDAAKRAVGEVLDAVPADAP